MGKGLNNFQLELEEEEVVRDGTVSMNLNQGDSLAYPSTDTVNYAITVLTQEHQEDAMSDFSREEKEGTLTPNFLQESRDLDSMTTKIGKGSLIDMKEAEIKSVIQSLTIDNQAERYEMREKIGEGGQAKIYRVYDRFLDRDAAVKIFDSQADLFKFLENSRMMAGLEHTNIPPIYNIGITKWRNPFIVMRLLKGETLKQTLSKHGEEKTVDRGDIKQNQIRMLSIFMKVCMAGQCAHAKGIIHQDIKPANIWLDPLSGEVFLLDWDLAKKFLAEIKEGENMMAGTPEYMAPEQAMGDLSLIDERTDVYALGAVLYEMVTGTKPYTKGDDLPLFLDKLIKNEILFEAPSARRPDLGISPELDKIILEAMAPKKEDRFATIKKLHDEIQKYLGGIQEGERKHQEAMKCVQEGISLFEKYEQGKDRLEQRCQKLVLEREKYKEAEARMKTSGEEAEEGNLITAKGAVWEKEAEIRESKKQIIADFNEVLQKFREAWNIEPGNQYAAIFLKKLYFEKFFKAERKDDDDGMEDARKMLLQYCISDQEKNEIERELKGDGSIKIEVQPKEAKVFLYQCTEGKSPPILNQKLIGEYNGEEAGNLLLSKGKYVLKFECLGFTQGVYPFKLEREEKKQIAMKMRKQAEIPEGFIHIPAGHFVPLCPEIEKDDVLADINFFEKQEAVPVQDFAISQFKVTIENYVEFLNDLLKNGRKEEAKKNLPINGSNGTSFIELVKTENGELFQMVEQDGQGDKFNARWPMFDINYFNAQAYRDWLTERSKGKYCYRLPTKEEWEKAATGGISRYPWGNKFEKLFVHINQKTPAPVDASHYDISPYGVRQMCGNMSEWTSTVLDLTGKPRRVIKGGNWAQGSEKCDLALNAGEPAPSQTFSMAGFRVACELFQEENLTN